tara:strand:+ start:20 stop:133 length:114 start_codon:yes stop_codon:yes gene_type:complete
MRFTRDNYRRTIREENYWETLLWLPPLAQEVSDLVGV